MAETEDMEVEKTEIECPSCGNSVTVRDYQQSTVICENCGRVLKEEIKDRGAEWRSYSQKERKEKSRAGPPSTETIHDKGLSTKIDWKNRDSRGNRLSPERTRKIYRMRRQHKRARVSSSKERNLAFSLSEIKRMSSQLGTPQSVQETASRIYRKTVEADLIRGRSMEGCASAALYAACRKNDMPRTLEEIAETSRVGRNEIGKTYRFVARKLNLDMGIINPASYISRYGSELDLPSETKVEAIDIVEKAKRERITSGKSPSGIAAGAIYLAAEKHGLETTQRQIADAADVTQVTVRNRYKELEKKLDLEKC